MNITNHEYEKVEQADDDTDDTPDTPASPPQNNPRVPADPAALSPFQTKIDAPACAPVSPSSVAVTLVTIASEDRFWTLNHFCSVWEGSLVVAVFSKNTDISLNLAATSPACSAKIDKGTFIIHVHKPTPDEESNPSLFPINHMRNDAISLVTTSHYFYIDVDFWPSLGAYEILHRPSVKEALAADPKFALVVPAFERIPVECDPNNANLRKEGACDDFYSRSMPTMRSDLDKLIKKKKVHVFERFVRHAHGSTNSNAWMGQRDGQMRDINCVESNRYEPYFVVMKCSDLPPFQEQFTGYGKNKIQHFIHLRHLHYKFAVLGGAFITHFPHAASDARQKWNEFSKEDKARLKRDKRKGKELKEEVSDFHRVQMDTLYDEFKKWVRTEVDHKDVEGEQYTHLCKGATDDDAIIV